MTPDKPLRLALQFNKESELVALFGPYLYPAIKKVEDEEEKKEPDPQ